MAYTGSVYQVTKQVSKDTQLRWYIAPKAAKYDAISIT